MLRSIPLILAVVTLVILVAASILPPAASAWSLNRANANIAYAASLPADSSNRFSALADAETQLTDARARFALVRTDFAFARVSTLRGDPARAASILRSADYGLLSDTIAQFTWAEAEWNSANPSVAYEHWRAAGAIDFFMSAANRARDRHDWQTMEHAARIAVGIAPARADARYVLGDALSQLSINDPDALREMARAAELTRDIELLSTIFSRQGEVLAAQGNPAAAFALFDRAMQIAPRDARPRTDYARTLWQTQPNARDRATELLKQSLALAPWDVTAYITLAEISESSGDGAGAEAWYQQGLARNANDARLLFALGQFYARQKRIDEAQTTLTLALKYETHADDLQAIARALAGLNGR